MRYSRAVFDTCRAIQRWFEPPLMSRHPIRPGPGYAARIPCDVATESPGTCPTARSPCPKLRSHPFVAGFSITIGAIITTAAIFSAVIGSPKALAQQVDFQLSTRCPPSFELTDGNACQFRSLYQLYSSPAGSGGLRVALPALSDGFTPQTIDLGRYLFFDPLLSADHHLSCAHCHRPDLGFADGRARSLVTKVARDTAEPPRDTLLPRGAPTLWNVGFLRSFFWDGRAHSLAEQAKGPLFASNEMNNSPRQLERDLNNQPTYRRMFEEAFQLQPSQKIKYIMVLQALSAFESTLISLNSRYDRYAHGDDDALTETEKRGLNIFRGVTLACSQCHTPPLFANDEVEVTGVPNVPGLPFDAGAGKLAPSHALRGAFKTPTLRNIARTAPYMHAGQFTSLREVVRFYNDRPGHAAPEQEHLQIDWRIALRRPVLSERDTDDVVAFLLTLTDESMMPAVPQHVPSGLPVVASAPQNTAALESSLK
jgi:cytochrome c peroxidase